MCPNAPLVFCPHDVPLTPPPPPHPKPTHPTRPIFLAGTVDESSIHILTGVLLFVLLNQVLSAYLCLWGFTKHVKSWPTECK